MANDTALVSQGKKARVLVVDDSKLVRLAANKILAENFDLVFAEDGEEAWQKICDDETIQVIFTDLGMPNMNGYELIERIRQSDNEGIRNQPVIVITGAAEEEGIRRKVLELGATDFITKPFKSTEMVARAEAHASYRRDHDNLQKNLDVDLLTGALNLAGVQKQIEKDVAFVNRHSENLAVILFELDNFASVVERIGKQTSDRIIKQLATVLLSAVRKEDSVGRYAPEQFIAILPMAKTEGVILLAKRLCAQIKAFKITVGGEPISISMSAGVATARKGSRATAEGLLQSAEQALVIAREVGPGEVQIVKLESNQADEASPVVSIDSLLEALSKGKTDVTEDQMETVLNRLLPLVALMSDNQKQRLLG